MIEETQYDLESRWITTDGIRGVNCRYGDIVRISTGEHAGETALVIALFSIDPPKYGVTLTSNEKFLWLSDDDLESTGVSSGRRLTLRKDGERPRTSEPR
jgi:hypothetical protein